VQLVHTSADAPALYAAALDAGFEGIVAKRRDSLYQPGRRSSAWLKIKAVNTSEFVIGGYTQGKGARTELGSLLLGQWQDGELQYVGHAGSGLGGDGFDDLRERLAKLATKRCPFASKPPLHRPTTWVEPELVAEIEFAGWTPDRYLRAPVFLRLRDDLAAHTVQAARPTRRANRRLMTPHGRSSEWSSSSTTRPSAWTSRSARRASA
jgi:bifunctional non-homologous end joining protein LigD